MSFFISKIIIAVVLLWLAYGSYVFLSKFNDLRSKKLNEKEENAEHWSEF